MRLLAGLAVVLSAGCALPTVSEGVGSLGEVGSDAVLLVGRIEIVPAVKPEEQTFKAGWDPFNAKRYHVGRAILFMSDKPQYKEHTDHALNPPLEETYFVKVPRSHRYMVKGAVTMSFHLRTTSPRTARVDQSELLFPAPIQLDIRPGDTAIYVGTLRLHRDEFHEVTKAEILDHYGAASAEFRQKFGPGAGLRKALLRRSR
jgi:hypothetical protein